MGGTILKFGSAAGLIVGAVLYLTTVLAGGNPPPGGVGMLIGSATMLAALSLVFVAIKQTRDRDVGGAIGFWRALLIGLGISAIAGIFYVAAWELALATTGMDFGATYAKGAIAAAEARGASAEEIARLTAAMAKFEADYRNPLVRLPMTFTEIFPVGVLVSLVSAGLLCNPKFLPARRG
ncbi:MAG: DUF4199 family protein [Alphaproteobacteria bacterium]|nr:DUF4199 family protein [Alphaproteobacteria bacterium]